MATIFPNLLGGIDVVAVDVGASHWLPHNWKIHTGDFNFILVEPNADACKQLEDIVATLDPQLRSRFKCFPLGLSGSNGRKRFFRANVPTGSSLYQPIHAISSLGFDQAYNSPEYYLPLREMEVDTVSLAELARRAEVASFDLIKLDTQGSELEILKGLTSHQLDVLSAVEIEVGVTDNYVGQARLEDVLALMRQHGLSLFDMRLNRGDIMLRGDAEAYRKSVFPGAEKALASRLVEVDAFFVRDPNLLIKNKDAIGLRKVMGILCAYRFFAEAFHLAGVGHANGLFTDEAAAIYRHDILVSHRRLAALVEQGFLVLW